MSTTYLRYELLRTFRNRRYFVLGIGFPLVLYFLIAGPNKNTTNLNHSGISAPLYFMVGLAAFGAMNAVIAAGARIAPERDAGWTRQLRLTPLTTREYFRAKIATAYLTAIVTIALLFLAGATLGVSLAASTWLKMSGLMLVGLIPFAALGILVGHLLRADAIGPAIGGSAALFAFLGGTWFPISGHGFLHDLAQAVPSYWLVQASRVSIGGHGWTATAWAVIASWTVVLTLLAARAYRRDTKRA